MHRKIRSIGVVAALVVLCLALPGAATANDSAIGTVGGAIAAIGNNDIRMNAETVQITALSKFALVRVDFEFVDSGPQQTVKLGFPFELNYEPDNPVDSPRVAAFRAWQDGKPLDVTWQKAPRDGSQVIDVGYFIHQATFKPGKTMIRVEYVAEPNGAVPGADMPAPPAKYAGMWSMDDSYEYWVHTGAGWKGTIGTSIIRFTLAPDFEGWGVEEAQARLAGTLEEYPESAAVLTGYQKPAGNIYQWVFKDYEPAIDGDRGVSKYDVQLAFFEPTWDDQQGGTSPAWPPDYVKDVSASSSLKLGEMEFTPQALQYGGITWAWAEGAPGPGIGEWVRFEYGGKRTIRELRIMPGLQRTPATFRENGRPKTLLFEFSDGVSKTVTLEDAPTLQSFPVETTASWAKVTIKDVYEGAATDDTYIAAIDFGKAPAPPFLSFEQLIADPNATKPNAPAQDYSPGANREPPDRVIPPGWGVTEIAIVAAVGCCGLALLAVIVVAAVMLVRRKKTTAA